MNFLKGSALLVLCVSVILGGCSTLNTTKDDPDYELVDGKNAAKEIKPTEKGKEALEKAGDEYRKENYVSVQEYIGEGFELEPDNGTDEIAENQREEVEKAVKKFFLDNYKTEITVHNIVGTTGAASVFVESVGEPHFYTLAIIPVDSGNQTINTDEVWSLEGEVEQAIITGLLAMIYDEEFTELDNYLASIVKEFPVSGTKEEALANIGANKFATPYYRLSAYSTPFNELLQLYLENPERSKEEWKSYGEKLSYDPEKLIFAIELFMTEKDVEPDADLLEKIANDIEKMDSLPRGKYVIYIHDNYVDKTSGSGNKENSIRRGNPDLIIKE